MGGLCSAAGLKFWLINCWCTPQPVPRASWWSAMTIVASFVTALFEPLMIGFKSYPGLYPWNNAALLEYLLLVVFSVDMAVCFYVPYVDKQRMRLVTDRALIRRRYLQQMFWVGCRSGSQGLR